MAIFNSYVSLSDSKFQLLGTTTESVMLISKTGTQRWLSQDHRQWRSPPPRKLGAPDISRAPVSGAAIHGHTTAIEGTIICQHQPKQRLEAFSTHGNRMKSSPNIHQYPIKIHEKTHGTLAKVDHDRHEMGEKLLLACHQHPPLPEMPVTTGKVLSGYTMLYLAIYSPAV